MKNHWETFLFFLFFFCMFTSGLILMSQGVSFARWNEDMPLAGRIGLRRKTGLVQSLVEKVAGTIPSEHTARAVCAVSGRRQTDDQQARLGVPKGRDGTAPVVPVAVGPALHLGNAPTVVSKPWAALAGYDLLL